MMEYLAKMRESNTQISPLSGVLVLPVSVFHMIYNKYFPPHFGKIFKRGLRKLKEIKLL